MSHPSERFDAPRAITKGQPLKLLMSEALVRLIGESFVDAWAQFDTESFIKEATEGLDRLELQERGRQIGTALSHCLPSDSGQALPILLGSLGPPLNQTGDIGLRPFFYFPHSHYLAMSMVEDVEAGLKACYHLTKRFTAEFCIRPLIVAHQDCVLRELRHWVDDTDAHVRRLVSEGTRPRLPWAPRLRAFMDDPSPVLELLERLKHDSSLYVRRSVANNLGDIAKDHLERALVTCAEWLEQSRELDPPSADNLKWVIRHALRHHAKKGNQRAKDLRTQAKPR